MPYFIFKSLAQQFKPTSQASTPNRVIGTLLALALLPLPMTAVALKMDNIRGLRYCEIILPKKTLTFEVYNTMRLNDCPANIWDTITVDQIKKETGAYFVHLNGPRYWVIDGAEHVSLVDTKQRILGGLAMRVAGILNLGLMDVLRGSVPYREHIVDRQTTWIYKAGKPVYELINPKGDVFVMQSYYSADQAPRTVASLSELGSQLTLSKGWSFRTGILNADAKVVAIHNKAVVIQDDFANTYQRATHDLLDEKRA